jgi:hypothetical protein
MKNGNIFLLITILDGLSVTAIEYEISKIINIPRQIFVSKFKKENHLQDFIDKISTYEKGDEVPIFLQLQFVFQKYQKEEIHLYLAMSICFIYI